MVTPMAQELPNHPIKFDRFAKRDHDLFLTLWKVMFSAFNDTVSTMVLGSALSFFLRVVHYDANGALTRRASRGNHKSCFLTICAAAVASVQACALVAALPSKTKKDYTTLQNAKCADAAKMYALTVP